MTGRRTIRPIAGQWTGLITLLLFGASVRSQLNTSATRAPSIDEPSGIIESRKIEPIVESIYPRTSKHESPEAPEALKKIVRANISEGSVPQVDTAIETGRLKLPEGKRVEEGKRLDGEFLPEFDDKVNYDEEHNLDENNDSREITTPRTIKSADKHGSSDARDIKEIGKKPREYDFSLLNDTNVNYMRKKFVKAAKDEDVYDNDYKNVKRTLENPTNVINSGDDRQLGSKSQVEVIKNSTKILRFIDETIDTKKEVPMESSSIQDLPNDKNFLLSSTQVSDEKTNKTVPRARTISFGGTNEFFDDSNKTGDSRRISVTTDYPATEKSFDIKPYIRVAKIDNPTNDTNSGNSGLTDPVVPESTLEASALENTIGHEDKKIVVTESSVVIDNSIQQIKPAHPKRSGNSSRTSLDLTASTSSSLTTSSTESMTLGTTIFYVNFGVSKTENDVPRGGSTSIESKETNGSLDLTGNGITEVTESGEKNSTSGITRATENNLIVQNTTDKVDTSTVELAVTSMDVETDGGDDSMLKISPLKVTEGTTRTTKVETAKSPGTTLMPIKLASPSSTTVEEQVTNSQNYSNLLTGKTLKPVENPSTPDYGPMDSTTSNVEYEFVGLTESAVSEKYIASTEMSKIIITEIKEALYSSTSSSILSTPSSVENESTIGNEENRETSTYPGSPITDYSEDSTTIFSSADSRESDGSSSEESVETTTIEEFLPTERNDTSDATTEIIFEYVTNFTKPTEIPDVGNTTESGRSADSSTTRIPEIFINSVNSSSTFVDTTEFTSYSSVVTDTTITATSSIEDTTSSSSFSTDSATSNELESSTTESSSKNSINIVTDNTTSPYNRAVSPDELTSLVRIIFEGNWADVCPHLPALRQSLADLLTSGLEKTVLASQIIFQKNPCIDGYPTSSMTVTTLLLYVVDNDGNFDAEMTKILPSLYSRSPILQLQIHSFQLVQDSGNAIAVVVVSCVALICLVLLAGLLFIMRKRQTRFNYGERCRPVSLDAYSLDSVSAYNSVRGRKVRASKRSYGNPTFEDSTATPSHPLNFAGLSAFSNEQNSIAEEFTGIPQVTARIDELPQGAEFKNRYANVVPLPETRVPLMKINNDPLTEYINASYVRGPKNATKYYIACQAPIESTVTDFWRMIWEQETKVVIMLTDLVENGVEKSAEYIPPSEVTDCHRLYGDFQVTLKKRETKEKYAISTLHLKNLENNTFREISHIWYLWPANCVQSDAAGLIAVLLEARALQRGGPGPVVVHCSPGTGRTGTLIALDLGIRQYEITRTVDVPRVVYTIRRDRAGAVQTKEQYAFVYKALNFYATKLAGGALE